MGNRDQDRRARCLARRGTGRSSCTVVRVLRVGMLLTLFLHFNLIYDDFLSVWPLFLFNLGVFRSISFLSFVLHCISCHCCICISRELGLGTLHFIYICICIRYTSDANLSFIPHLPLSLCENTHECLELLVFFLFLIFWCWAYCESILITRFLSGC